MNILDRQISNQSATIITSFFKLLIVFLIKFFCQMSLKKMSENSKTSSLQFSRAQGNGLAFI